LVHYGLYIYSNRIVGGGSLILRGGEQIIENHLKKTGYKVIFSRVRERLISLGEV